MKTIILEYASAAIAVFGAIVFLLLLEEFFMGEEGILAMLIQITLGGL